jgi:hypothetical protein
VVDELTHATSEYLQDHQTKMDIAEMMQRLLAKMDANTKTMQNDIKTKLRRT